MTHVGNRYKIKNFHEISILNGFVSWLNTLSREDFQIVARPNPPDAIIKGVTQTEWLEHTDAYRSDEEAKEELSLATPGGEPYKREKVLLVEPDKRIVAAILNNVHRKLQKNSYKEAFEKYGPGTLIISERDALFDEQSLELVRRSLPSYYFHGDRGYFKRAYLCIRSEGGYFFELLYEKTVTSSRLVDDDTAHITV